MKEKTYEVTESYLRDLNHTLIEAQSLIWASGLDKNDKVLKQLVDFQNRNIKLLRGEK